jgi:hypothetical protein
MTDRKAIAAASTGFYTLAHDLAAKGVAPPDAVAVAIATAAAHVMRDTVGPGAAAELLRDLADLVERDMWPRQPH